jgi:DNA-binding SARP family transcriptional activator/TolB-like protein
MYTLQMLGGISVTNEAGAEVDALLRQSKHVALLAYLASPSPGTWHKRDSVIGMFWAEHDQTRARSAFRSALYTLRGHLPENAIRSRGDNDLSVDPQIMRTDAATMSELLDRGEYAQALALYKGEFLPGIYIADAPGFDQWLEQERRRTRALASEAARQLSKKLEAEKDQSGAIRAARYNYDIDPDDESTARRLIALLDRSGDRAQAFAVYEQFRDHIYEAFGVRPSAETVALLDAIRTRHEPTHVPVATANPVTPPAAAKESHPCYAPPPARSSRRALALVAIPLAVGAIAWTVWPREKTPTDASVSSIAPTSPAPAGQKMVVLPFNNSTGDPSLEYLSTGIAEDLAQRLDDVGGFNILSAARSSMPLQARDDLREIVRAYKADLILRGSIRKSGDSLQVAAEVVDSRTLKGEPVDMRSFSLSSIADVESNVAADIAGKVFQRPLPPSQATPVDSASYRLTLQGIHQLLTNVGVGRARGNRLLKRPDPLDLFLKARNTDPNNARAYTGISSALASRIVSDQIPFDEGYLKASAAANRAVALDGHQGAALANLGMLRALKFRRLSEGLPWIRKAEAAEPSNPEVYLVKSALYRNAHMWEQARDAIRVAQRLDPLSPAFIDREAVIEICAGRPANALTIYRSVTPLDPSDGVIQGGITRTLALLGRYDEAISSWRADARFQSDTGLVKVLANIHGQNGYWDTRHAFGRQRLKKLLELNPKPPLFELARTTFAAGDSARGFSLLDQIVSQDLRAKYRIACMPDLDEYRTTPRMKDLIARAGALPP